MRVEVARPATTRRQHHPGTDPGPVQRLGQARGAARLIRDNAVKNAIVFCNRKTDVDIVAKSLQKHGFNASPLHGDLDQSVRTRTLDTFRAGTLDFLVASDVAARGLDIPAVSHIFNYDAPYHPDDYVHRIAAPAAPDARDTPTCSVHDPRDGKYVEAIERLIGKEAGLAQARGLERSGGSAPRARRPPRRRRRWPRSQSRRARQRPRPQARIRTARSRRWNPSRLRRCNPRPCSRRRRRRHPCSNKSATTIARITGRGKTRPGRTRPSRPQTAAARRHARHTQPAARIPAASGAASQAGREADSAAEEEGGRSVLSPPRLHVLYHPHQRVWNSLSAPFFKTIGARRAPVVVDTMLLRLSALVRRARLAGVTKLKHVDIGTRRARPFRPRPPPQRRPDRADARMVRQQSESRGLRIRGASAILARMPQALRRRPPGAYHPCRAGRSRPRRRDSAASSRRGARASATAFLPGAAKR